MKKLFLMMGLACLFMVACDNAPEQKEPKNEPQETPKTEIVEFNTVTPDQLLAEYENWENLDAEQKDMLNSKALDYIAGLDAQGIDFLEPEEGEATVKDFVDPNTMSEEMREAFDAQFAIEQEAWKAEYADVDAESLKGMLIEALTGIVAQFAENI